MPYEQFAGLDSADSAPESICAAVAKIFHVRETEVGLLELDGPMCASVQFMLYLLRQPHW